MTLEPLADASTAEVVAQRIRDAILDYRLGCEGMARGFAHRLQRVSVTD